MNDEVWLKLAGRVNELARDARRRRRRHHARHRHDRGDGVLPQPRREVEQAGRPDGGDASVDRALGRRPAQFLQRRRRRRKQKRRRAGVLVVINDWIHGASSLTKTSTTAVQTFMSPLRGLVGTVAYGEADFFCGPVGRNTVDSDFSLEGVKTLPRVDIVMAYENMDGALIDAAAAAGAKGIVIGGVGNGNMTEPAVKALAAEAKKGVVCVRSSRVVTGRVGRNVELDDDKLGFVASLGPEPPEGAGPPSPRAPQDERRQADPEVLRRVLTMRSPRFHPADTPRPRCRGRAGTDGRRADREAEAADGDLRLCAGRLHLRLQTG